MLKPCSKDDVGATTCKECGGTGVVNKKYSEFAPSATIGCFSCSSSRFKKGTGYTYEDTQEEVSKNAAGQQN